MKARAASSLIDEPVLTNVAKSFCRVADIAKAPVPGREPGTSGFEIIDVMSDFVAIGQSGAVTDEWQPPTRKRRSSRLRFNGGYQS